MHPWLAQQVCTRSAHAAVSKVSADAVLKKKLNEKNFILILFTHIIIIIIIIIIDDARYNYRTYKTHENMTKTK